MSADGKQDLQQTIISGYQSLVDEVSGLVDAQKLQPATDADITALEALGEELREQVAVTAVQPIKLPTGVITVVVTQDLESTTAFIQSCGHEKHCTVRRARWGNDDIEEAGKLLTALDDADIIETGGGVSASGDFAYTVMLAREVPELSEQLSTLPEELVTVRVVAESR
ncbi:hypothetical protein [Leucobacter massiliensis]|uniref:hypothetical protein n=1 Tax=Leucobacter massiliensis TaxID=1686285 RepID=UPI0011B29A02|nr:hypothetical protein [Leucobacter massiliensis]